MSIEIVVSIPKLDQYRGAVEIINSHLDESSIQRLNGSQMGEYFGASLCVVDVNNDGYDKRQGRVACALAVSFQTR
jgi:hypothetical protein